jgi:hypothetical protein
LAMDTYLPSYFSLVYAALERRKSFYAAPL